MARLTGEPGTARRATRSSVLRFLAVGGLSYVVDAGTLAALHGGLGVPLLAATSVAFATGLAVNFGLNRTVVFAARSGGLPGQFTRYLVLVGVNYLLTLLIVGGLAALGVNYLLAKTIAVALNAMLNYTAYRFWVFR